MILVVDASALAAVLFSEPEAADVAARLDGHQLNAPMLLSHELASVGMKKVRRHRAALDDVLNALENYARLEIALHEVPAAAAARLAADTGLSAYDASYLWLAQQFGAPLVTLDRQLETAANA